MPNKNIPAGVNPDHILYPEPISYEYGGRVFEITAMTDSKLIRAADALDAVVKAVGTLASSMAESGVLALVPQIFKTALPEASKLIATSTGLQAETVARIPLAHKIGFLHAILEAEDIALLVKKGRAVMELFLIQTPPTEALTEEPDETEAEETIAPAP